MAPAEGEVSRSPSFSVAGRLAVVIGASEGIGATVALELARAGARVAVVGRVPERLAPLVAAVRQVGGEARAYRADVRVRRDLEELARSVDAEQGVPAILVNSAGVPMTKPALDVTEEEWDAVMDTNLKGVFFACVAFGRAMGERGYGKIINLSSTWSESVGLGKSVYATSKAGVSHLTRSLALEWAPRGVRVNAIAPTLTLTPTRRGILDDPERWRRVVGRIPLGRPGEPSDLVGAALFLASEASDFVTGQTLFVDGGWNAAS